MPHPLATAFPLTALATAMLITAAPASAYEGDIKRGRLYYRQICTTCHQDMARKTIAPNEMTKAQWATYLKDDKHDKTGKSKPSLKYYMSKEYRASIKASNKVADKLANVPDAEIQADLAAWVAYGAKDSDTAAGCN